MTGDRSETFLEVPFGGTVEVAPGVWVTVRRNKGRPYDTDPDPVSLAIDAPPEVRILRGELLDPRRRRGR